MKIRLSNKALASGKTFATVSVAIRHKALCVALNECLQRLDEPQVGFKYSTDPNVHTLPKVIKTGEGWRVTFTATDDPVPVPVVMFETLLEAFKPNINWSYKGVRSSNGPHTYDYPKLERTHLKLLPDLVNKLRVLRRTDGFSGFITS